jgi:hypothetical protein
MFWYEYAWTKTFSEPFNGTVSCTANVAVFVSNPQLAVEEFAIPSGWQAEYMADAMIKVCIFTNFIFTDPVFIFII